MTKKNLFYNGKRIAALSAAVMLAFASVPFRYMAPAYATEEADINYFDLTGVSLTDTWTTDGVTYELYDNGLLNLSGTALYSTVIYLNVRAHNSDYLKLIKAINCDVTLSSTAHLFSFANNSIPAEDGICAEEIRFTDNFINSTSNLTDMSNMFYSCTTLRKVNVSDFDTSNVTDMNSLFRGCKLLEALDLSKWDTSKVTNMFDMFCYCVKLETLTQSFDTSSVTNMAAMFDTCSNLKTLDVSGWDTSNVIDIHNIFNMCHSIDRLDVSNWNTGKVTSMDCMFQSCDSLTALDVSDWNTSNVTSMCMLFSCCSNLFGIDVSNWVTDKVTDISYMFQNYNASEALDVSQWNTSNVETMSGAFAGCMNITSLDVSNWDTHSATKMNELFRACQSLDTLDISKWDVSNVTDMERMFYACIKLTDIDVSLWTPLKLTNAKAMFGACSNITALDLSNFNLTNVNISSMLDDMNGLHMLKAPTLGILDTLYLPTVMSWLENNTYHEDMESSTLTGYNIDSMMGGAGSTIITNTDYAALQANGHRYTEWTSTDDTHEERHCTICGYSQTKEKHIHSYTSDITTQPTCDTPGVRTYTCAGCGDTYTEPIDALGHIQSEVHIPSLDKAPTCTEDGYTYYEIRCSRDENGCGHKLLDEKKVTVAALGHNAGEPVIENRIEATYTTAGSYDEVIYCTRCNTELSRVHKTIPILTHSHVYEREVTKAPTCTEKGIETFTCKLCNDTYTDEIPALGHDWDNGTVTKAPACEEEGIRTYTCKRDSSHTYTETIPMLLHTWGNPVTENVVEPTCTEAGHYDAVSYCTVCGKELERNTFAIGALGHVVGETVIENRVEPTCTEDGHYDEVHYCTRCNTELNRTRIDLDKLGHLAGEPKTSTISAPTCTTTGTADKVTSCIRCKTELERTEITLPALGHIEGAIVSENSVYATCTEDGHFDAVVYCAREENGCNHSELFRTTIATPALGHSAGVPVIENRVQPTYDSEGGYDTVTYCTRCNIELSRVHTVLDRLTKEHIHDYKITDSKEATCLERGYTKHTCSCGDTYYDYTSALGHEPGEAVVENRVEAEVGIEGHYDEVIYCEREVNGCDHSELSRVTKTIPALEVPYEPGESTHIEIETTSDNSIVVPVVVATVAAISGASAALIFFIYWRRRKVRGVVHGEVVNGLHITLEGKDNLETYTNEDGEFEFKNLKPDTYMLTIFDENDSEIFSTEIYTHAKKDENIFEVISSAVADNSLAKAGQTYIIDITR